MRIKPLNIDFLYLDLNACERCKATDTSLNEAMAILSGVFYILGYAASINKVNIVSSELAEQYRFESSPTIRINGVDIFGDVQENNCKECGDLCGGTVDCRVFAYEGQEYEQPPTAMVVRGILDTLFGEVKETDTAYALPDNLKNYFAGASLTQNDADCGCPGGQCC